MSYTQTFPNPDGSSARVDVAVTYTYTPAPPAPPQPPPAPDPLFWAGTSWRSSTDAANWPNTRFGLIFFNPANNTPFSASAVAAAIAAYPHVLWCVCDKGDPGIAVPQVCTLARTTPPGLWYVYDQEPEGDDPTGYRNQQHLARSLIDARDARDVVKLVGKYARYPNVQTPGLWKTYWAGTPANPVEDIMGWDCYARPGVQFPTTRYGTAAELFDPTLDAADEAGVPLAITEYARLPVTQDAQGTLLADQTDDDVAYLRRQRTVLGVSFWPGKGEAADFTPLPAVRTRIRSIIRSQG